MWSVCACETKLTYRQATARDFWIDDPKSPDYNRWVTADQPPAVSHELMRRGDEVYRHGAVIEYNTAPVVSGKGSAIFLHVWRGPGRPTDGCVAVAEPDLLRLLKWLDKAQKPVVVLNP
jgi:L,D-peptidoglycan transpeptidase YkuD (ErfK/YbiS/YcfS/YnhG family)